MPPQTSTPTRRLTISTKFIYGFGSVAFGVKDSGFNYFLLIFYNQVLGLPSATVGLAIMAALFCDAFLDPIIGQVSDNWRSRWGRRHPFMYAAALPAAVSFLLLWNPPAWHGAALVGYLIGVSILIRSFISLYEIPSAALVAELTTDYDERTRLLAFRYLFGWFGGVGVAFLALQLFLKGTDALSKTGYARYGIMAAAVMFVAIVASAAGTHREIPYLRAPPDRKRTLGVLAREMVATLTHLTFLKVLMASLFVAMATGLMLSSTLYLNRYFWELSDDQVAQFTIASVISAMIAFGLAPLVSRGAGKRTAAMALMVCAAAAIAAPLVARLIGVFPPNGSALVFPLVLAAHLVSTACTITVNILISSMTADVVEDFELRTGRRSEGLFFSATAFVAKAVSGVGIFAASILLWVVGFPEGARPGEVDPGVLRALGLAYFPTMAVFYACGLACLSRYRITRESHAAALDTLGVQPPAKG